MTHADLAVCMLMSLLCACADPSGVKPDDTSAVACEPQEEVAYDGIDQDCDGRDLVDVDGDGWPAAEVGGEDCDDGDPTVNPYADEICNGVDDDCDGLTDGADDSLTDGADWCADADGDSYGDAGSLSHDCSQPSGYVADCSDCDDGDAAVNPDATELSNGADDDCDGLTDGQDGDLADGTDWCLDADGDGYGDAGSTSYQCSQPAGYAADCSDCDDGDAAVNPGATELADDGVDNDCNGWTDIDADLPSAPEGWTVEVYAGGIDAPMALAFDSAGNLYVGQDEVNGQIHVVPAGGGTPSLFGPVVQDPDAVAVGADDTVYIGSEGGLYRVETDGSSGVFVTENMGNNTFIAVDFDGVLAEPGLLYVANARASTDIVQVTPEGESAAFISSGSLYVTFGICFDGSLMYAAESESGIEGIYTIDADGELSAFLTEGLSTPHGIVYDAANGWFFVGDKGAGAVYTMYATAELELFAEAVSPRGFTLDDEGNLYVSDHTTDPERILRFSPDAP